MRQKGRALIFTIAHFLLFGGVSVAIANQLNKSLLWAWAHAPKFSFWGCLQFYPVKPPFVGSQSNGKKMAKQGWGLTTQFLQHMKCVTTHT